MNPTIKYYEPPISEHDMPTNTHEQTTTLDIGVYGFTQKVGDEIFIPLIVALREGRGDVGRFLDHLSPRCVIVSVTSDKLRGMLERRGWKVTYNDEAIDFWRRPA